MYDFGNKFQEFSAPKRRKKANLEILLNTSNRNNKQAKLCVHSHMSVYVCMCAGMREVSLGWGERVGKWGEWVATAFDAVAADGYENGDTHIFEAPRVEEGEGREWELDGHNF